MRVSERGQDCEMSTGNAWTIKWSTGLAKGADEEGRERQRRRSGSTHTSPISSAASGSLTSSSVTTAATAEVPVAAPSVVADDASIAC